MHPLKVAATVEVLVAKVEALEKEVASFVGREVAALEADILGHPVPTVVETKEFPDPEPVVDPVADPTA